MSLIYRMAWTFPEAAAKLMATEGGHWVLAVLLPQMRPQDRLQIAATLNTQQLIDLIEALPADVAAMLLTDIYTEDSELAIGFLRAVSPQCVAEVLGAVGGSALAKAVAALDRRTRRTVLSWLDSDDPVAIEIRRIVIARWQLRLGATAFAAALVGLIVGV